MGGGTACFDISVLTAYPGFSRLFRIMLTISGCLNYIVAGKGEPCQNQSGSKTGVKDCNKYVRTETGGAQADAKGHHKCHDDEGFAVKEF